MSTGSFSSMRQGALERYPSRTISTLLQLKLCPDAVSSGNFLVSQARRPRDMKETSWPRDAEGPRVLPYKRPAFLGEVWWWSIAVC